MGSGVISDAEWDEVVTILGQMAASKNRPNAAGGWRDAFEYMPVHLERAGLTSERLASLNYIHVAGTKGKGSTCAMVESILRACGYRTGLYTSPHLVDVRERIRLDSQMLPRSEFAASFRRVHGRLSAATAADGDRGVGMPSFFSFITLVALDAFLARPASRVPHVVVLEVGIGGRLDATNGVVTRGSLAAAAVTSLGFDHMDMLGDTLPKIAREKAGIMKAGRPVLVAPQPQDAMEALQEVAARVGARLAVPPPLERYAAAAVPAHLPAPAEPAHGDKGAEARAEADGPARTSSLGCMVGLGGEHMRVNASLAVALAAEWEAQYAKAAAAAANAAAAVEAAAGRPVALPPGGPPVEAAAARSAAVASGRLPPEYLEGLRSVRWPGRSQVIPDEQAAARGGRLTFYLDGAHTPESMATCAAWFRSELAQAAAEGTRNCQGAPRGSAPGEGPPSRHVAVLLFNCMRDRDPAVLLPALADALRSAEPAAASATGGVSGNGNSRSGGGRMTSAGELGSQDSARLPVIDAAVFTPMLSGGGVLLPAAGPQQPASTSASQASSGHPEPQPQHHTAAATAAKTAAAAVDLGWQEGMLGVWSGLRQSGAAEEGPYLGGEGGVGLPGLPSVSVAPSLPAALEAVRAAAAADPRVAVHVLVTGSLYLVGDVLRLLNKPPM
ncbi:hypothetical protein GPECTOR_53g150 [Gonium pectorale]|uniref:tetrahydrofolate synthase n=1 Tax=Gonium pectorale TaxID=33097 RepID=A0A150G6V3_GONPE|nr:hypothetical protein GPECTOR_53g150 [Gonium pectorale]|eukprot:KXZ45564.1 hypothetical protein GPECTOR_53g150 [Gonium pectorale]